jgi:hypothetical protein
VNLIDVIACDAMLNIIQEQHFQGITLASEGGLIADLSESCMRRTWQPCRSLSSEGRQRDHDGAARRDRAGRGEREAWAGTVSAKAKAMQARLSSIISIGRARRVPMPDKVAAVDASRKEKRAHLSTYANDKGIEQIGNKAWIYCACASALSVMVIDGSLSCEAFTNF